VIPGLRYGAPKIYPGRELNAVSAETLELKPGEVRDLGDILTRLAAEGK
jgi:hypothetical protein